MALEAHARVVLPRCAVLEPLRVRAVWVPADRLAGPADGAVTLQAILLLVAGGAGADVSLREEAVEVLAGRGDPAVGGHRVGAVRKAIDVAPDGDRLERVLRRAGGGDARPQVAVDA